MTLFVVPTVVKLVVKDSKALSNQDKIAFICSKNHRWICNVIREMFCEIIRKVICNLIHEVNMILRGWHMSRTFIPYLAEKPDSHWFQGR